MNLFFDPKTHMVIDVTSSTQKMVNYHFSLEDCPQNYDKYATRMYQVAPDQLEVGNIPFNVRDPELIKYLMTEVPNTLDFHDGCSQGLCDGLYGVREYFRVAKCVSWSFLIGYEYGFLMRTYEN